MPRPDPASRQRSAAVGSERALDAVRRRGGLAPRADVLNDLSAAIGRRAAGCAIQLAVIGGRLEPVVLLDGRIGLREVPT